MDSVLCRPLKEWEVVKREIRIAGSEGGKMHELLGADADSKDPLSIRLQVVFHGEVVIPYEAVLKKRRDSSSWNLYIRVTTNDDKASFRDCPLDREARLSYTGHDNAFQLTFGEQKKPVSSRKRKSSFSSRKPLPRTQAISKPLKSSSSPTFAQKIRPSRPEPSKPRDRDDANTSVTSMLENMAKDIAEIKETVASMQARLLSELQELKESYKAASV